MLMYSLSSVVLNAKMVFYHCERWARRIFFHHVGVDFCMPGWFYQFFPSCGGFRYDADVMVVVIVILVFLKFYLCCSVGRFFHSVKVVFI